MFGELTDKIQELVTELVMKMEAENRVRARFQVAGTVLAGMLSPDDGVMGLESSERARLISQSLDFARELEAAVYTD